MGYDIDLYSLSDFVEEKVENGTDGEDFNKSGKYQSVVSTYLSYNFDGFHDWEVSSCFGKTTNQCIPELRTALKKLNSEGCHPIIPLGCDEWTSKGEEGKNVFCYHVKGLLKLFEDNPFCVIVADIGFCWKIDEHILEEYKNKQQRPSKKLCQ